MGIIEIKEKCSASLNLCQTFIKYSFQCSVAIYTKNFVYFLNFLKKMQMYIACVHVFIVSLDILKIKSLSLSLFFLSLSLSLHTAFYR